MSCSHVDDLTPVPPRTPQGCEECLKLGAPWVHFGCASVAGTSAAAIAPPAGMPPSIFTRPPIPSWRRSSAASVGRGASSIAKNAPLPAAAEPYLRD